MKHHEREEEAVLMSINMSDIRMEILAYDENDQSLIFNIVPIQLLRKCVKSIRFRNSNLCSL